MSGMIMIMMGQIEDDLDRALAEEIYEKYKQRLYKRCRSRLGQRLGHEAEDAVCDVMVLVCKYIKNLRGLDEEELMKKVFIYAKGVCLNRARREKIVRFEPMEDEGVYASAVRTDEDALAKMDEDELMVYIDELKDKLKEALQLSYYMGQSDEEIAEILEISHENVRVRLSRAREELQALMEREEEPV